MLFLGAIILGAWFRLYPVTQAGFPINDGGLFFRMIATLQENRYRIPESIEYNQLEIPFAYPPLGFYLGGLISSLFDTTILDILQWVPAIISILVLPAIYSLALLIFNSRLQAGLSAFLYALMPRSTTWFIMGGGMTRGLGQLFLILTVINVYQMYRTQRRKSIILTILTSTLLCLSHPEASLHTIGTVFLLWAIYGRNKVGTTLSVVVGVATLILTAPWWLAVVARHGFDPFVSASQTGLHNLAYVVAIFLPYSGEEFIPLIMVLAIVGTAGKIARNEFFLPLWLITPFVIDPRSAPNVTVIPMAFLAASALIDVLIPSLHGLEAAAHHRIAPSFRNRSITFILVYLFVSSTIGMNVYSGRLSTYAISQAERRTMRWISDNTLADSKFLVITGAGDLFLDRVNEWFPVLTQRKSLTTIQGSEWLEGDQFPAKLKRLGAIQMCPQEVDPANCIDDLVLREETTYDYIYLKIVSDNTANTTILYADLIRNEKYQLVYQFEDDVIFRLLK